MKEKDVSIYANYDVWFAKKKWTLQEWGALRIGLNPNIVFDPNLPALYDETVPEGEIVYQLYQYSREFCDWHKSLHDSTIRFYDYCCAGEMDELFEKTDSQKENHDQLSVKPMDIIQWSFDRGWGFHYNFIEYLQKHGFAFRFSENSKILSELKIHAKIDVWFMPIAALLILGLSPDYNPKWLGHIKNYYRHIDPNFNMTKRDEVYYVLETALQSWKTGKLDFFHFYGDDPEEHYYDYEECGVEVEARVFVDWAIQKGFEPPAQLLELMGYDVKETFKQAQIGGYQTPYMVIMQQAINALEITANNQPTKQTIIEWLRNKDNTLSGRELDYLATFIRMPDMKKGGYYKGKA